MRRPRLCQLPWSPLLALVPAAAIFFFLGIDWGLPSRQADPFLFGDHPVWTGAQLLQLAGPTEDPQRGADVASHRIDSDGRPVVVNETDEQRARIVRRYRLMSHQPDEWNTLKALSEMKPGQHNFDPKLYQYGGLWVYPVGALLKACGLAGLITLRPDMTYYLDHPEAIGRFYVVARTYSAMWGLVGVIAVYAVVYRICRSQAAATVAGAAFLLMPLVVNAAHEAKPHLAGTVLMLLAVLAASRYVTSGSRRAALLAGICCGAAFGMVLSSLPVFLIIPGMVLLRKAAWRERIKHGILALAAGGIVYVITNPYVLLNQLTAQGRAIVRSNLGTSAGMYHADWTGSGLANAALLVAEGMSAPLAVAGILGALALAWRAVRLRRSNDPAEVDRRATGLLLCLPAIWVGVQFILLATGKPAEYARFALYLNVVLMIEAVVALETFLPHRVRCAVIFLLLFPTAWCGVTYVRGFLHDASEETTRMAMALRLRDFQDRGASRMAVQFEPAPWSLPPVDLFRWRIVLAPGDRAPSMDGADVAVWPADFRPGRTGLLRLFTSTPISWASKPFGLRFGSRDPRRAGDERGIEGEGGPAPGPSPAP